MPSRARSFSIPLRASVSATSRAVSSAEKTSVTPRPKTRSKHGPDQRVVRAAEDHRVDARGLQRRRVLAHRVARRPVDRRAGLDQRHEPRAGDLEHVAPASSARTAVRVAPARDGRLGREHARSGGSASPAPRRAPRARARRAPGPRAAPGAAAAPRRSPSCTRRGSASRRSPRGRRRSRARSGGSRPPAAARTGSARRRRDRRSPRAASSRGTRAARVSPPAPESKTPIGRPSIAAILRTPRGGQRRRHRARPGRP